MKSISWPALSQLPQGLGACTKTKIQIEFISRPRGDLKRNTLPISADVAARVLGIGNQNIFVIYLGWHACLAMQHKLLAIRLNLVELPRIELTWSLHNRITHQSRYGPQDLQLPTEAVAGKQFNELSAAKATAPLSERGIGNVRRNRARRRGRWTEGAREREDAYRFLVSFIVLSL